MSRLGRPLATLAVTATALLAVVATPGAASAAPRSAGAAAAGTSASTTDASCWGPAALASRSWTFVSPTGVTTTRASLGFAQIPGGGTATVSFVVRAGCTAVPFVVASYRDPIAGYTDATASQQTLFAASTGTFSGDGRTHSLTVALPPSARTAACPNPHTGATGNGGGANGPGQYGSTCDGSPSANGNGNGHGSGRPCAGCVGNADNKNPPGQAPNGSDPNAGYECDRNSGVGRTNPAHSGCAFSQLDFATGTPITHLGPNGSGGSYGDTGGYIEAAFGVPPVR